MRIKKRRRTDALANLQVSALWRILQVYERRGCSGKQIVALVHSGMGMWEWLVILVQVVVH